MLARGAALARADGGGVVGATRRLRVGSANVAPRVARATLQGYIRQKREVIVPWYMHGAVKMYQLFPSVVEWRIGRMAQGAEQ